MSDAPRMTRSSTARRPGSRARRAIAVGTALILAALAGFLLGWATRGVVGTPEAARATSGPVAHREFPYSAAVTAGCPAPRRIVNIPAPANVVAITFDDGPSVDTTEDILRILAAKRVKATFFETGEHASTHPDLVAKVAAAGHAVGSHSWSHPRLSSLPAADLKREIEQSTAAVSAAIGRPVCLMRPPFGDSNAVIEDAVAATGLTQVGWTDNPIDWENPTPAQLTAGVMAAADGHPIILLLHEHGREDPQQRGPSPTVAALGDMIDGLRRAHYTFVQVDGTPFPT